MHSVAYPIGYSPTFLIAFIENLFLNKIQFNWGILRSWALPGFHYMNPYLFRVLQGIPGVSYVRFFWYSVGYSRCIPMY